jgi:hypothetical protein
MRAEGASAGLVIRRDIDAVRAALSDESHAAESARGASAEAEGVPVELERGAAAEAGGAGAAVPWLRPVHATDPTKVATTAITRVEKSMFFFFTSTSEAVT